MLPRAERPALFAAFQQGRFFLQSQRRWNELARTARVAVVFADFGEPAAAGGPPRGPVPVRVPLPARREWTLVCDSRDYLACVTGWEFHGQPQAADPAAFRGDMERRPAGRQGRRQLRAAGALRPRSPARFPAVRTACTRLRRPAPGRGAAHPDDQLPGESRVPGSLQRLTGSQRGQGPTRRQVVLRDSRRLVYVSGAPGSGKTGLAVPLAAELGCPLLAKNRVKETLPAPSARPNQAWPGRAGSAGPR